jgi:hypothetical protein
MKEKYGYWLCNNIKFTKRIEAFIYASAHNCQIQFYYHDDVWNNLAKNRNLLVSSSMNDLYRQRAQQIRDTYKYLILYYSGGADSHNILRTFIDNDIKLDEICVKWPKLFTEKNNLYTPNTIDTSARNYWSEWDFCVKPSLDWIRSVAPDIKITFKDYLDKNICNEQHIDNLFKKGDTFRYGGTFYSTSYSDSAKEKKNVGHIYGIDKPLLSTDGENVYMFFTDATMHNVISFSEEDPNSTECFYWSPDFPELTYEMAYRVSEYFNNNKKDRIYLWSRSSKLSKSEINNFQHNLSIRLLYNNWDYRFQAAKPNRIANATEKWWLFVEHPEFKKLYDQFHSNLKSLVTNINERFYEAPITRTDIVPGLVTIPPAKFFVRKLDQ